METNKEYNLRRQKEVFGFNEKEVEEYTPIRQFFAWVGFIAILAIIIATIVYVIKANRFIDANMNQIAVTR